MIETTRLGNATSRRNAAENRRDRVVIARRYNDKTNLSPVQWTSLAQANM
jgi:hypothetical protein